MAKFDVSRIRKPSAFSFDLHPILPVQAHYPSLENVFLIKADVPRGRILVKKVPEDDIWLLAVVFEKPEAHVIVIGIV